VILNFLFWNVRSSDVEARIARIADLKKLDVILLAEFHGPESAVCNALERDGKLWQEFGAGSGKVRLFSALPSWSIQEVMCDLNGSHKVFAIVVPGARFLLSTVHLHSKMDWNDWSQVGTAMDISKEVARIEDERNLSDTIMVGDFNMHPFDPGMVMANCLHAVPSKSVARRRARKTDGKHYRFFYNPTWTFLSDWGGNRCGTFYLPSAMLMNYFWCTYDQVLVRPSLINRLGCLQVLEHDGETSLLTNYGLPDKKRGSDHLPLHFSLQF
jgi:hypothetical protein